MSSNTTTTPARPTVRQALDEIAAVRAEIAAFRGDLATVAGAVTSVAEIVARSQAFAPAAVAEATVTAIGDAPSAKPARKSAPRKAAASKATSKPARKATVQEAAQATVQGLPTIDEARALVDAGGDAWKIRVLSTEGNPIPFGLVLRAEKAAARKAAPAPKAPAKKAPAKARKGKAAQVSAEDAKRVFVLGGKDLAALAAKGDAAAQAEIDRRAAKRAAK